MMVYCHCVTLTLRLGQCWPNHIIMFTKLPLTYACACPVGWWPWIGLLRLVKVGWSEWSSYGWWRWLFQERERIHVHCILQGLIKRRGHATQTILRAIKLLTVLFLDIPCVGGMLDFCRYRILFIVYPASGLSTCIYRVDSELHALFSL